MVAEAVELVAEGCRVAHPRRRMRLDTMQRGARFDSPASPTQKCMCDTKDNILQTLRNSSRGTSTSRRPRSARSWVWRSAPAERFRSKRSAFKGMSDAESRLISPRRTPESGSSSPPAAILCLGASWARAVSRELITPSPNYLPMRRGGLLLVPAQPAALPAEASPLVRPDHNHASADQEACR